MEPNRVHTQTGTTTRSTTIGLLLTGLVLAATGCTGGGSTASDAGTSADASAAPDAALAAIDAFVAAHPVDKTAPQWKQHLPKPELVTFTPERTYYWNLETNLGSLEIRLMPEAAPMHVTSTIYLTRLGFYDGLTFHRVVKRFMAQGGDPLANGTGGPGYHYDVETSPDAKHDKRGVLSMANGGPGTEGSQFFLLFGRAAYLDGGYSVFGQVVDGMDTLDAIEERGADTDPGKPSEPIVIQHATIRVE